RAVAPELGLVRPRRADAQLRLLAGPAPLRPRVAPDPVGQKAQPQGLPLFELDVDVLRAEPLLRKHEPAWSWRHVRHDGAARRRVDQQTVSPSRSTSTATPFRAR